jgi:hypothetical protein
MMASCTFQAFSNEQLQGNTHTFTSAVDDIQQHIGTGCALSLSREVDIGKYSVKKTHKGHLMFSQLEHTLHLPIWVCYPQEQ